jgi:acetyl-CoA C-acetyltransferase
MVDTMMYDALTDAFHKYLMGTTAENVAKQWQLTRDEQDEFAVNSQNKAEAAQKAGKFKDEIVAHTIKGRKGDTVVDEDEYIKHGVTVEGISKLRPAFDKEGTVTAANASGINDGGAATVLMSEAEASKRGITPMARIASWATAGVDPADHGHRPDPRLTQGAGKGRLEGRRPRSGGSQRGLRRSGLRRQQGHGLGSDIVNVNGGAIAIGHPVGASRRARAQHAALRNAEARRQERSRDAVHRRRHGRGALRRRL